MRALVSDQSSSFNAKVISGPPDRTVVASLALSPGSWVVFATVALAGNAAPGATVNVQMFFELDSKIYVGGEPMCFRHLWHGQRFSDYSLDDRTGARHAENSPDRLFCNLSTDV